jgi:hypothetical protein
MNFKSWVITEHLPIHHQFKTIDLTTHKNVCHIYIYTVIRYRIGIKTEEKEVENKI